MKRFVIAATSIAIALLVSTAAQAQGDSCAPVTKDDLERKLKDHAFPTDTIKFPSAWELDMEKFTAYCQFGTQTTNTNLVGSYLGANVTDAVAFSIYKFDDEQETKDEVARLEGKAKEPCLSNCQNSPESIVVTTDKDTAFYLTHLRQAEKGIGQ